MGRAKKNVEVEAQVIARGNVVPMISGSRGCLGTMTSCAATLLKFSKWSVSGSNLTMPETFPDCRMTTRQGASKIFSSL